MKLESLIERLVSHRVDFVVVGGYAAVALGSSQLTRDLDVCCRFTVANLLKLQNALAGLKPVHRMTVLRLPFQITPRFCKGLKNLYLDTDEGQLDCLGSVKGLGTFRDVKKLSMKIKIENGSCYVLKPEALIRAKKAMGSPKDLETARELEAIYVTTSGRKR